MRRIICDQYEFEPPDSEQSLELAIATPSHHFPDLKSLLVACEASAHNDSAPPPGWRRWQMIASHLKQFADIDMPHPNQLRGAMLICDDWNDVEVGIAFGSTLVWYHWLTTA
jgi:hypothetical protein